MINLGPLSERMELTFNEHGEVNRYEAFAIWDKLKALWKVRGCESRKEYDAKLEAVDPFWLFVEQQEVRYRDERREVLAEIRGRIREWEFRNQVSAPPGRQKPPPSGPAGLMM